MTSLQFPWFNPLDTLYNKNYASDFYPRAYYAVKKEIDKKIYEVIKDVKHKKEEVIKKVPIEEEHEKQESIDVTELFNTLNKFINLYNETYNIIANLINDLGIDIHINKINISEININGKMTFDTKNIKERLTNFFEFLDQIKDTIQHVHSALLQLLEIDRVLKFQATKYLDINEIAKQIMSDVNKQTGGVNQLGHASNKLQNILKTINQIVMKLPKNKVDTYDGDSEHIKKTNEIFKTSHEIEAIGKKSYDNIEIPELNKNIDLNLIKKTIELVMKNTNNAEAFKVPTITINDNAITEMDTDSIKKKTLELNEINILLDSAVNSFKSDEIKLNLEMISGESDLGKMIVECEKMMDDIIKLTQQSKDVDELAKGDNYVKFINLIGNYNTLLNEIKDAGYKNIDEFKTLGNFWKIQIKINEIISKLEDRKTLEGIADKYGADNENSIKESITKIIEEIGKLDTKYTEKFHTTYNKKFQATKKPIILTFSDLRTNKKYDQIFKNINYLKDETYPNEIHFDKILSDYLKVLEPLKPGASPTKMIAIKNDNEKNNFFNDINEMKKTSVYDFINKLFAETTLITAIEQEINKIKTDNTTKIESLIKDKKTKLEEINKKIKELPQKEKKVESVDKINEKIKNIHEIFKDKDDVLPKIDNIDLKTIKQKMQIGGNSKVYEYIKYLTKFKVELTKYHMFLATYYIESLKLLIYLLIKSKIFVSEKSNNEYLFITKTRASYIKSVLQSLKPTDIYLTYIISKCIMTISNVIEQQSKSDKNIVLTMQSDSVDELLIAYFFALA